MHEKNRCTLALTVICFLASTLVSGCKAESLSGNGVPDGFGATDASSNPTVDFDASKEGTTSGCTEGVDDKDPCMVCTCNDAGEKECNPVEVGN